jgi:spermidine synthase
MLTFGVSIYAYSAVLTAYMGGLAIGGYFIGKWADRVSSPVGLFAWLHLCLSVLGVISLFALGGLVTLYASLTRSLAVEPVVLTSVRLGLSLLALAPSTICIGATLPVMSRVYARQAGQVGGDVGRLYAANTLGAVFGCALTALLFIRLLGARETVFLASFINLLIAGAAWYLKRNSAETIPAHPKAVRAKRPQPVQPVSARRFVLWAYAISGFVALGYEVAWARIIALHTLDAIYSFSIILTVFLSGLFLGGLLGAWWVRRRQSSMLHFGALELGIGLLAIGGLFVFAQLPSFRFEYFFARYSVGAEIAFEGLLSFVALFPATTLIGLVFPIAGSLYTAEQTEQVGLRVAQLTALNTVGSILGTLLTGFVIVPALGLQNSILLLAALNLGIGATAIWFFAPTAQPHLRPALGGILLLAAGAGILLPPARYLGPWQDIAAQLIFYKEGIESTVAVFKESPTNPKFSAVNGRVEVPTDVLSLRAFYLLGHLPALLRPNAQNALMLSFGNGIATGSLATHRIPSIEVVELAPEMIEAAELYEVENRNILRYPGLQIHIEDARNFLLQTNRQYDIITTDATHPSNTSSWALFTTEFYAQVKQHLTPDGVFLQWVPLHSLAVADYLSILRTFQSVFPNAILWYTGGTHTLLLATPQELTREELETLLRAVADNPTVQKDLGRPDQIPRYWIMNSGQLRQFAGKGSPVYDNNAFFLPINTETQQLVQVIQLAAVRANQ